MIMRKVSYYPGCTLKTTAKGLETAAVTSMEALGLQLEEIENWNCCGVVHSLADDDLIHHLAPIRNLIRAQEQGSESLITLCSMCYNTLARANLLMKNDPEKRKKINLFMDEEPDYHGDVAVYHLLPFLRDYIGWETLKEKVKIPLADIKIAPYYGCMLTRPREVSIETQGRFGALSHFLVSLGATVPDFPASERCCGSYQILGNPQAAKDAVNTILKKAFEAGVEALALTCPLCDFNIRHVQGQLIEENRISREMPLFYFTQLLAIALGQNGEISQFGLSEVALKLIRPLATSYRQIVVDS